MFDFIVQVEDILFSIANLDLAAVEHPDLVIVILEKVDIHF